MCSMHFSPQPSLQKLCEGGLMIRVKTIMVPVDFSEPSKKAVNYGLSLALEFGSRLILTHITPYDQEAYESAKRIILELIPHELRVMLHSEMFVQAGGGSGE